MGMPRRVGPEPQEESEARDNLARNLTVLIEQTGISPSRIAKLTGVAERTVYNCLNKSHDPSVSRVHKIASVFGLQGWQLLLPVGDYRAYDLLSAYENADDNSKRLIDLAVQAARSTQKKTRSRGNEAG